MIQCCSLQRESLTLPFPLPQRGMPDITAQPVCASSSLMTIIAHHCFGLGQEVAFSSSPLPSTVESLSRLSSVTLVCLASRPVPSVAPR